MLFARLLRRYDNALASFSWFESSGFLFIGFRILQKRLLHRGFAKPAPNHDLIDRVARDDVVDEHRAIEPRLHLPHGPDALDDLLVLLQVPPVREDHQDVATVLQVEPVPDRGWAL